MNFKDHLFHSSPLFFTNNMLKFVDKITLENILFDNKSINRKSPPIFYDWFTLSRNLDRYQICCSVNDNLSIPTFSNQKYARFSIRAITEKVNAIYSRNSIQDLLINNLLLKNSTPKRIKCLLSPFVTNAPFFYPLKTSENLTVF